MLKAYMRAIFMAMSYFDKNGPVDLFISDETLV